MRTISKKNADMMMECALLAIGKLNGANYLYENQETVERVIRSAFEVICKEHKIDAVRR